MEGWQIRGTILAAASFFVLIIALCASIVYVTLIAYADQILPLDVNRIAYIGLDGNLYTVDANGEQLRELTSNQDQSRVYLPTWSPADNRLAYLDIPAIEGEQKATKISMLADSRGGQPELLYESLSAPPFYLSWSPNGKYISFLTQENSKPAMRLANTSGARNVKVISTGAPYYWAWSSDSENILIHTGGSQEANKEARFSLYKMNTTDIPETLQPSPGDFQAPAWDNDNKAWFGVTIDEKGQEYIARHRTDQTHSIAAVRGSTLFVTSPDVRNIAYLEIADINTAPFGLAYIVPTSGGVSPKVLLDQPVISLYWAPDGKKIAILAIGTEDKNRQFGRNHDLITPVMQGPSEIRFQWWFYDIETGEAEQLASFNPTADMASTMAYFDQYAKSLTFWSPDSQHFVYVDGENREGGSIFVLDVGKNLLPPRIAKGRFAVWSWR